MRPKMYLRLLQVGLALSLFFVLFVFSDLLFPYISSKQLSFNILMEILAAIWLVFILRYPAYRPKLSLAAYGLFAYFAVILISSFTGVDFNLSFWGDVERMLGFFHLFHFLIFYLILITIFRTWEEWRALLAVSVGAATIVSLIGLFGKNPYSTIGNTTYVSGYLIFNLFFAAILFLRTRDFWRYAFLVPVLIMALQFKNMRTSGAIIGLAAGLFVVAVLVGFLHEKRKIRIWLLSLSALTVIIVGFVFSQQQAAWFQNSFLRNLTSQKITFQTRLLSWQGAWRDFERHPFLGTGFGNYSIIFDRQFQPEFFNYDRFETYFDRAHNNLIDIASTTGLAGLLTYLSIFVFALLCLFSRLKVGGFRVGTEEPNQRRNLEIIIIFGLMVAYFVQNLAVFDSFVTYIALMMMLGFIAWLPREQELAEADPEGAAPSAWLKGGREGWALAVVFLIAWLSISAFSLRPWKMLNGVIMGYAQIVSGRTIDGLASFRAALSGTPLDRDGRTTLINLAATNPIIFTSLPAEEMPEAYEYVLSLAYKNLAYNPLDNLSQLQLSQMYDLGARLFYEDEDKRAEYSAKALEFAEQAIASSPGRIPTYFSKAQALIVQNKLDEAIATLEYAVSLNPDYPNSYCRLGQIYGLGEDNGKAVAALTKCIEGGAVNQLGTANALIATASFLVEQEAFPQAIIVVEKLLETYKTDPEIWFNLAKLYLRVDKRFEAMEAANQAIALDKDYAIQAEYLFGASEGY